jgi:hypothetical protein
MTMALSGRKLSWRNLSWRRLRYRPVSPPPSACPRVPAPRRRSTPSGRDATSSPGPGPASAGQPRLSVYTAWPYHHAVPAELKDAPLNWKAPVEVT